MADYRGTLADLAVVLESDVESGELDDYEDYQVIDAVVGSGDDEDSLTQPYGDSLTQDSQGVEDTHDTDDSPRRDKEDTLPYAGSLIGDSQGLEDTPEGSPRTGSDSCVQRRSPYRRESTSNDSAHVRGTSLDRLNVRPGGGRRHTHSNRQARYSNCRRSRSCDKKTYHQGRNRSPISTKSIPSNRPSIHSNRRSSPSDRRRNHSYSRLSNGEIRQIPSNRRHRLSSRRCNHGNRSRSPSNRRQYPGNHSSNHRNRSKIDSKRPNQISERYTHKRNITDRKYSSSNRTFSPRHRQPHYSSRDRVERVNGHTECDSLYHRIGYNEDQWRGQNTHHLGRDRNTRLSEGNMDRSSQQEASQGSRQRSQQRADCDSYGDKWRNGQRSIGSSRSKSYSRSNSHSSRSQSSRANSHTRSHSSVQSSGRSDRSREKQQNHGEPTNRRRNRYNDHCSDRDKKIIPYVKDKSVTASDQTNDRSMVDYRDLSTGDSAIFTEACWEDYTAASHRSKRSSAASSNKCLWSPVIAAGNQPHATSHIDIPLSPIQAPDGPLSPEQAGDNHHQQQPQPATSHTPSAVSSDSPCQAERRIDGYDHPQEAVNTTSANGYDSDGSVKYAPSWASSLSLTPKVSVQFFPTSPAPAAAGQPSSPGSPAPPPAMCDSPQPSSEDDLDWEARLLEINLMDSPIHSPAGHSSHSGSSRRSTHRSRSRSHNRCSSKSRMRDNRAVQSHRLHSRSSMESRSRNQDRRSRSSRRSGSYLRDNALNQGHKSKSPSSRRLRKPAHRSKSPGSRKARSPPKSQRSQQERSRSSSSSSSSSSCNSSCSCSTSGSSSSSSSSSCSTCSSSSSSSSAGSATRKPPIPSLNDDVLHHDMTNTPHDPHNNAGDAATVQLNPGPHLPEVRSTASHTSITSLNHCVTDLNKPDAVDCNSCLSPNNIISEDTGFAYPGPKVIPASALEGDPTAVNHKEPQSAIESNVERERTKIISDLAVEFEPVGEEHLKTSLKEYDPESPTQEANSGSTRVEQRGDIVVVDSVPVVEMREYQIQTVNAVFQPVVEEVKVISGVKNTKTMDSPLNSSKMDVTEKSNVLSSIEQNQKTDVNKDVACMKVKKSVMLEKLPNEVNPLKCGHLKTSKNVKEKSHNVCEKKVKDMPNSCGNKGNVNVEKGTLSVDEKRNDPAEIENKTLLSKGLSNKCEESTNKEKAKSLDTKKRKNHQDVSFISSDSKGGKPPNSAKSPKYPKLSILNAQNVAQIMPVPTRMVEKLEKDSASKEVEKLKKIESQKIEFSDTSNEVKGGKVSSKVDTNKISTNKESENKDIEEGAKLDKIRYEPSIGVSNTAIHGNDNTDNAQYHFVLHKRQVSIHSESQTNNESTVSQNEEVKASGKHEKVEANNEPQKEASKLVDSSNDHSKSESKPTMASTESKQNRNQWVEVKTPQQQAIASSENVQETMNNQQDTINEPKNPSTDPDPPEEEFPSFAELSEESGEGDGLYDDLELLPQPPLLAPQLSTEPEQKPKLIKFVLKNNKVLAPAAPAPAKKTFVQKEQEELEALARQEQEQQQRLQQQLQQEQLLREQAELSLRRQNVVPPRPAQLTSFPSAKRERTVVTLTGETVDDDDDRRRRAKSPDWDRIASRAKEAHPVIYGSRRRQLSPSPLWGGSSRRRRDRGRRSRERTGYRSKSRDRRDRSRDRRGYRSKSRERNRSKDRRTNRSKSRDRKKRSRSGDRRDRSRSAERKSRHRSRTSILKEHRRSHKEPGVPYIPPPEFPADCVPVYSADIMRGALVNPVSISELRELSPRLLEKVVTVRAPVLVPQMLVPAWENWQIPADVDPMTVPPPPWLLDQGDSSPRDRRKDGREDRRVSSGKQSPKDTDSKVNVRNVVQTSDPTNVRKPAMKLVDYDSEENSSSSSDMNLLPPGEGPVMVERVKNKHAMNSTLESDKIDTADDGMKDVKQDLNGASKNVPKNDDSAKNDREMCVNDREKVKDKSERDERKTVDRRGEKRKMDEKVDENMKSDKTLDRQMDGESERRKKEREERHKDREQRDRRKKHRLEESMPAAYCFVEFKDPESAQKALYSLNGKIVPNSGGTVRFKLNHASYGREHLNMKDHSIFVGSLSDDVDDYTFFNTFIKKYPGTMSAKVVLDAQGKTRGYGFVRFKTEEERDLALKEMQRYSGLGSNLLHVSLAQAKTRPYTTTATTATSSSTTTTQQTWSQGWNQGGPSYYYDPYYGWQQYSAGYSYDPSQYYDYSQYQTPGYTDPYAAQTATTTTNPAQTTSNMTQVQTTDAPATTTTPTSDPDELEDPGLTCDVDKLNAEFMQRSEELYQSLEGSRWHPLDNVMSTISVQQ